MIKQEIEKVEKEITLLMKIETHFSEVRPEEVKRLTDRAISLFGDRNLREILRKFYIEKVSTLKKCQKIIEERDKSELEFLKKVFNNLGHDPKCITNFVARNLKERISFLEGQKK